MWRQAYYALLCCWLASSPGYGSTVKTVNSSIVKDVVSAESAPRLYRNVPLGVYASAAPYAAYSFHMPAFVTAPKTAASRIVPVINNANGYLKDSYGNRFADTTHAAAYKTAFPQQFLQLQALPAHLSQPLVASASQARQPSPHYFLGSQYRGPTFQVASHSPTSSIAGFSQPIIYSQNLRSLVSPSAIPTHTQAIPVQQQQPSSDKVVYPSIQDNVQFQRLQQHVRTDTNPSNNGVQESRAEHAQIQAAPATITAIVNGKKTIVNIETKPPVPLLDLSLLEPLKFDNPLVPQVQHLPLYNDATHHKQPEFNVNEVKNNKKEFTVQKAKSYDSGLVKSKHPSKKKPKHPSVSLGNDDTIHEKPAKPTITVKGTPNSSPEFSYEINSPNYKETYNEKSVSYNKATSDEPLTYSYDEKTQSEPITYSYTKSEQKKPVSYSIEHNSDEPAVIKHITYQDNGQEPKQLVYKFNPVEQSKVQNDHQVESEYVGSAEDTSEESDIDGQSHPQNHNNQGHQHQPILSPQQGHLHPQSHHIQNHPQPHNYNSNEENDAPEHSYDHRPQPKNHQSHHQQSNSYYPQTIHARDNPHPSSQNGNEGHGHHHGSSGHTHNFRPQKDNTHHDHRLNENVYPRSQGHEYHKQSYAPPEHRSEEIKVPVQTQYPVTQQYEEDIRIVPSEAPAANLKETSNESSKESAKDNDEYDFRPSSLSTLGEYQKFIEQQMRSQQASEPPQLHNSAAPVILEKAKRIIIQEESPEEMHSHQEQNVRAEMINDDGNNEEEFEAAYKNAAFGFDAYNDKRRDHEKNIYSPESYGFPRGHNDFDVEKNPFQEYVIEGDSFPKSTRANYKDARDNTKDDYYSHYSIHKPESMADLYTNKANYYKLYKKYKPENYFSSDNNKKNEKYIVAPSFDFKPRPEKKQNYFAQYKTEPVKYEYSFGKQPSRDSSPHASHTFQRLKSKTHFVEPQFQYGFEPIALPRLLDSELAAMATNNSPETEKPGMRKKIYKENWYIKKTSTSGGKPS